MGKYANHTISTHEDALIPVGVPYPIRPEARKPPPSLFTTSLRDELVGDLLSAVVTTLGVAPFMSVIDKAIVQNANKSHTISSSVRGSLLTICRDPIGFVKSPMFLMMWGVYASTYATANCIRTICERKEDFSKKEKTLVFAGTTAVNSSTSLVKDKMYATMFAAASATPRPSIPMLSYGCWMARDCMVIGSSFVAPRYVTSGLSDSLGIGEGAAANVAQFFCPVVTQLFAGPVQLLGLDLFNRPKESIVSRANFVKSQFVPVVAARIARIAPAYGIGGIGNTGLRNRWRQMLITRGVETAAVGNKAGARELVDRVVKEKKRKVKTGQIREGKQPW